MELNALICVLSSSAADAHPVDQVEIRQTHISAVFLAGPFAYKIKKPVDLGFVDFTTLEKRRHFCQEEVRLNRRLAPHVYQGVVPVVQVGTEVKMEGPGRVIEWAVKMQRLPDAATLQKRLRQGEVLTEWIESLARRIAAFHQAAQTGEAIAACGRFDAVARNLRDVFGRSAAQVGQTVSRTVFERLQVLTEENLTRSRSLIEERSRRGMTRNCHGDLHLDHIYLFPDRASPEDLVLIDCIEFADRYRFIDPVADIAFVVMDLAFYGRRDLARTFVDTYFRVSGDQEGEALLKLYVGYRATVRGSVEGLKLAEKEITPVDRTGTLETARAHWLLALAELELATRKPCLVLVAGLPGTGKSSLARSLSERANFQVIRSDVVRKELAAPAIAAARTSLPTEQIYSQEWSNRTYAECLRRAELLLFEGGRVLIDATFREESHRRNFLDTATRWGLPGLLVVCRALPETVRARLTNRRDDVSDAEWSTYLKLAAQWQEAGPPTKSVCWEISTEGDQEQVLNRVLLILNRVGLA